jgi:hypothetical protein
MSCNNDTHSNRTKAAVVLKLSSHARRRELVHQYSKTKLYSYKGLVVGLGKRKYLTPFAKI